MNKVRFELFKFLNQFQVTILIEVFQFELFFCSFNGQTFFLHYEIFKDGKRVNPLNYYSGNLTAEEFDVMLNLARQENQSMD